MDPLKSRSCEANIASHCNLNCQYCDQWAPFWVPAFLPLDGFARDLERLSKVLWVEEFKILGGEPLLNPQLPAFIKAIQDTRIAGSISLVTNGLLLPRMSDQIWQDIDILRISLYPGVRMRMSLHDISERARMHDVKVFVQDHIRHPFRLTGINSRNTDRRLVQFLYDTCDDRRGCNTIHRGRFYTCTQATVFTDRMKKLGITESQSLSDGVSIHEVGDLRTALKTYLDQKYPLEACAYCLGCHGRAVPADQGNKSMLAARLTQDHSDITKQLDPKIAAWFKQTHDVVDQT